MFFLILYIKIFFTKCDKIYIVKIEFMRITKISWRNIGSFGNKIQTIDFSNNGQLWHLSGKSGAGKSTLLSLPILALYGKTKDVKVGDIANRVNKKGWIKFECMVNNDEYIIERTFSPSNLSITKNGELLDRARDMQGIIDNEIVCMPYNIFTNILSLSLNNFKSFIDMSPSDKRQIIDKIFSLDIINKIYELIKKDLRDLGNSINNLNAQIFSYEQTIKRSTDELERLRSINEDDINEKISGYNNVIANLDENINANIASYNEHKARLDESTTYYNSVQQQYNSLNNDISNISKKISLFNQHKCPLCETDFDNEKFADIKNELTAEYNEKNATLTKIKDVIKTYSDYIAQLNNNIITLNNNRTSLQSNRAAAVNAINMLNNSFQSVNESSAINNIIADAVTHKDELENNKVENTNKMRYLQILDSIYNANGIKTVLMDNYIPLINDEISHVLQEMSFPYNLKFDNNFNAHLEYMGTEIGTSTLSTGETKKVDLAVLISMIKIIKLKYPQLNVICLDETVSSIDYDSCIDICKILTNIATDLDINILIVSHIQLPSEYFSNRIEIVKSLGFSDMIYN